MESVLYIWSIKKSVYNIYRICSNNAFFDQRCNKLDHWLHEGGYSEGVVSQDILKALKIPRSEYLQKEQQSSRRK